MHMYILLFQKFKTTTTEVEGIVSHKTVVASQNNWKRLKIFEVILFNSQMEFGPKWDKLVKPGSC